MLFCQRPKPCLVEVPGGHTVRGDLGAPRHARAQVVGEGGVARGRRALRGAALGGSAKNRTRLWRCTRRGCYFT